MDVTILQNNPLTPLSTLGPYRKADYVVLPDDPRCELIYGRFYLDPSRTVLHQATVARLCMDLYDLAKKAGGIAILGPIDVTLADHSIVEPDVVYVSSDRCHVLEERIEGVPDLLVEVLLPSTARRDRGEKLKLYAESGVREYWLADPVARHIDFLVNRDGRFLVALALDDRYKSEVLPEIEIDLAALWRDVYRHLPEQCLS